MLDADIEFNDHPGNRSNITAIAEYIDNDFFAEAIKEQIEEGLDCNTVNYLESLEVKLEEVKEKYDEADYENLTIFMQSLYGNILNWISDKYQISIEVDSEYMEHAAKEMYSFFVINLKQLTTYFLIAYINENVESIIRDIPEEKITRQILERVKVQVDEYRYLAATNIEEVITQIGYMDFTVDTFLRYAASNGDSNFDLGYSYSDEDDLTDADRNWTIIDDQNDMIPTILRQVTNGEYDRTVSVELTDRLMELWDVKSHIEESGKPTPTPEKVTQE